MSSTAKGLILLVLVVLVFALTFTAATIPVKTAKISSIASPVPETKAVTGTLTDRAVTFMSESSLVLPPAAVDWVLSTRRYDSNASQGAEVHH
jgi:hypothetical protein